jgi:hypothetical protein
MPANPEPRSNKQPEREGEDRRYCESRICEDCNKPLAEHGHCEACGHYDCDCICEFLRTEWPTHPANPDRIVHAA